MDTFKVIGARYLVEKEKPPAESKGGIVIPDSAHKRQETISGVIRAVGTGRWIGPDAGIHHVSSRVELELKVGDRVRFGQHAGSDIDDDGKLVSLHEDEILAVYA